jgi:hypothetical protein
MRRATIIDFTLNVVLPIVTGMAIYFAADKLSLNKFIRNQLPDGLWAYSLISCTLII